MANEPMTAKHSDPMTGVLTKIFARGFYKVNSGLLVFMFAAVLSYCFFIETAGDIKLLSPAQVLYYNFIMLINFVSNPIIAALFFAGWLAYTVKSWYYVSGQLQLAHHQFVFYGSAAFSRMQQFKSWCYVQMVISLPFVFYAVVASVTGIVFRHYLMVAAIWGFTLQLIVVSALIYMNMVGRQIHDRDRLWVFRLGSHWRKPFFSLFIFQIFDALKLNFVLTKILSYLIITWMMFSLADVRHEPRVIALTVLGFVTAHAMLIYQHHKFQLTFLSISRNLPYSLNQVFANYLFSYLLLLMPEVLWLFKSFNPVTAFGFLLLALSITMLFHCLLYKIGLAMNRYLPWILGLFLAISVAILFGLVWLLVPVCFGISLILFNGNYYKAELKA